jgi:hypothetical protein
MRFLAVGFLGLVLLSCVKASGQRDKYVGKSGCASELNSPKGHSGIRLDKTQRARLEAHVFENESVLTIVQYSSDADKCGIVRDVVRTRPAGNSFVWECTDRNFPSAVVVGTWPPNFMGVFGPALEAWRIDLKKLRFVRLDVPVTCDAGNYAGPDEGDDLVGWARKRSAKQ